MLIHNAVITGSLTLNGIDIGDITGSEASVASLNAFSASILSYTASNNTNISALQSATASLQTFSSSILSYTASNNTNINALQTFSSSILTYTASNDTTNNTQNSRLSSLEVTSGSLINASASFSTRVANTETTSSNLTIASASFSTRVANNEATGSSLVAASASFSTRVANTEATSSNLVAASASFSSSISSLQAVTGSYATTGSNTFVGANYFSNASNAISFTSTSSLYSDGGMRITKDMYVSGTAYFNNVTVYGTQSISYISSSQLNIGTNIISVNTDTPTIRFGGLSVYDSGSTGLTGSILWDSENNHWIYTNPSGSSYSGGMLISGPRNTSGIGNEVGTTCNAIMKGQGGDHITSSGIFDYGNATCFYGNSHISSSGNACFGGNTTIAGNLGVGTITPGQLIDVYKTSNDAVIRVTSCTAGAYIAVDSCTDGYYGLILQSNSNQRWFIGGYTTSDLTFRTSQTGGSEWLRINRTSGIACFTSRICAPAITTPNVRVSDEATYGLTICKGANSYPVIFADGAQSIGFITAQSGVSYGERLRISHTGEACFACTVCLPVAIVSGCVGINTTAPDSLLHVLNCSNTPYSDANALASGQWFRVSNPSTCTGATSGLLFVALGPSGGNGVATINGVTTSCGSMAITFGTRNASGNVTERMRITSGGTVSIGATDGLATSTYAGKLAVFTSGAGANITTGTGVNTTNTVMSRFTTVNTNNANSGNESSTQFYGITSIESALTTATSNVSGDSGGYIMFKTKGDAGTLNERLRVTSEGITCFACQVCAPSIVFCSSVNNGYTPIKVCNPNPGSSAYTEILINNDTTNLAGLFYNSSTRSVDGGVCSLTLYNDSANGNLRLRTGNNLVLATGSPASDRLVINKNGCVGVNTTSPGFLLDLKMSGALRTDGLAIRRSTNDNHQLGLWTTGGEMYIDAVTDNVLAAGVLVFRRSLDTGANFSESMRFTSTGIACFACQVCAPAFVGGTVSGTTGTFSGKLSVSQASTDFVAEFTNTANSTPYGLRVKDAGTPANNYPLLSVTNNAGSIEYFRVNSGTGMTTFTGVVCSACRICSAGLTVEGTFVNNGTTGDVAYISSNFATAATNGRVLHIRDSKAAVGTDSYVSVGWTSSPGQDVYIGKRTTSSAGFLAIQNSSATELLTINLSSANVGIGTTTPNYKLEVSGNACFTGGVAIGGSYCAFALNVHGVTYQIGGSTWVQNGYGYVNSGATTTGLFPLSDSTIQLRINNSSALTINSAGVSCFISTVCAPGIYVGTNQENTILSSSRIHLNTCVQRFYTINHFQLSNGSANQCTVVDGAATYGCAKVANINSTSTFFFGPYSYLTPGSYVAKFRMKVDNNSSKANLFTLDTNRGGGVNVSANTFCTSGCYQYINLPFTISSPSDVFEARGLNYNSGITCTYLDHVLVEAAENPGQYFSKDNFSLYVGNFNCARLNIDGSGNTIFNCNGTYCSSYGYNFLGACNGNILSGPHTMGNVGAGTTCATPFWCSSGALRMEFNWSSGGYVNWINHNNCVPYLLQWSADNYVDKFCFDYNGRFCACNTISAPLVCGTTLLSSHTQQKVDGNYYAGSLVIANNTSGAGGSNWVNLARLDSWQSSNSRIIAKVTVLYISATADQGNEHVGYAMLNYAGNSWACAMTVSTGATFGNSNVGTLRWCNGCLQYCAPSGAYFLGAIKTELATKDGASVTLLCGQTYY